jgi:hypothetical protein
MGVISGAHIYLVWQKSLEQQDEEGKRERAKVHFYNYAWPRRYKHPKHLPGTIDKPLRQTKNPGKHKHSLCTNHIT